ncbi:hypothetical protein R8871_05159 [Paraburkholderia graminis C4D1M]|jgi:uncharacterized membrane protein (DUF485 family)|uniref:DUF485 domain-containing protein n=2 Tax=Paraburkholderia graminis TaxID=60548 RepID=B1G6N1_PARG4|nr:DUF485 domain-containing protein [Paraburkholderia graminis]EDT08310.1 protein of unknown function DUF485 [Paraburkholderia graminis C4D1M]CAB3724367.1 hypothetical protein R8871_05159 [Paraburkholderia graminis C4D1M]
MKSARHENIEAKEAEMHPTEFGNLEFDRLESAGGVEESTELVAKTWELAKTRNRFVWPLLVGALAIYFGLLILVLSSPAAMSQSLYGEINIGLAAVAAQLLVTVAAFWAYCTWAAAKFDARAASLRLHAQQATRGVQHV